MDIAIQEPSPHVSRLRDEDVVAPLASVGGSPVVAKSACDTTLKRGDVVDVRANYEVYQTGGDHVVAITSSLKRSRLGEHPTKDGTVVAPPITSRLDYDTMHHLPDERRRFDTLRDDGPWCYHLIVKASSAVASGSLVEVNPVAPDASAYGGITIYKVGDDDAVEARWDSTLDAAAVAVESSCCGAGAERVIPYSICRNFEEGDLVDVRALFQVKNTGPNLFEPIWVGSSVVRGRSENVPTGEGVVATLSSKGSCRFGVDSRRIDSAWTRSLPPASGVTPSSSIRDRPPFSWGAA